MNPLTPEEDKQLQDELRLVENRARTQREDERQQFNAPGNIRGDKDWNTAI